MSYFMRSVFASLHMLIISQITVVGDMVDRCAGSRSWRYQGLLGMWWIDVLGAGRGDTKDNWGMWWIDVLGADCGDTRDYWGMGSMGLWTVGLLCAPSAGLFYMKFSPTRQLDCSICGFLLHVGGIFVSLCFFI